ncbi:hypothetical protein FANTH_13418 [Fusarium anthophilum]|uniref:PiggyBac transposable element-derived protein domain-containing protein n=1 Tax=Fusarium anthophilum TaxID=48485 RepID=A0A8H5DPW3_9HYPO|nr:hypothetical protein FANTH_13418 [Fusarium anthophilum]
MLSKQTYHVFVDNLFSTQPLFRKLRDDGHEATGTARPNYGIHKNLKRDKKVNQIVWKDNSLVLFITTVFQGDERTGRKRKKPSIEYLRAWPIQRFLGEETTKVVPIPTVAAAYNDEMNHVDGGDQLRSYTSYDHPIRQGAWQALTWTFLLDVVLTNSYILQLHGPQSN